MKKIISMLLILCLMMGLVACGNKSSETNTNEKLTIVIWDTNQEKGIKEILKSFTEQTGIETELQVVSWDSYWTLLEAGATGGDLPDVFWMHSNQALKYMSNEILLDITDLVESTTVLEMDKFPVDIKEMYGYDGKTYAIPKDIDTVALWYNKKIFDEAGISYPDEDWTWDTFYDVAVKLTKEDGSQYGTALKPTNEQSGYFNIIYSMGGEVISYDRTKTGFDNEKTIKAMEYVEQLVKNAMPPNNVVSETGEDVLFNSGKIAMLTQGSWMVAGAIANDYVNENCDVAVLPMDKETGKRVSIYNGLGWAAAANTKNPEGAKKLLEFLGSKEMQLKQAELGVTMSAYEGVSENWKDSAPQFNLKAYLDMLDSDIVFRPYSKDALAWYNMIHLELKEPWAGNRSMKETCAIIGEKMNEMLANE